MAMCWRSISIPWMMAHEDRQLSLSHYVLCRQEPNWRRARAILAIVPKNKTAKWLETHGVKAP
uniref:Uncharacterized protein n=1 Tax=Candidatus Kentrum sp. TC TaxID=2126339 RepID=A0A450YX95_9GAMM|nr:MAG: hypothetical protein BECKTC1821D_GA0114238_102827 [Candidatus Kentron sp. TC]